MSDQFNDGVESPQNDSGSAAESFSMEDAIAANQQLAAEQDASKAASIEQTEKLLDADDQTAESDEPADPALEADGDGSEDADDVESLLEASKDSESSLIKKLRAKLEESNASRKELSAKLEDVGQRSEGAKLDAESLVKQLKSFDVSTGQPTSRPFAENLFTNDRETAEQLFEALATQTDEKGWTLAHHFLQKNGIDPTRIEEIQQFLRGEVGKEYRSEVPEAIPREYQDAFKTLSKKNQEDVLYDLEDEDASDEDRHAAMQVLRDRQFVLEQQREREASERQRAEQERRQDLERVTESAMTTYRSLFESLESSATLTNTTLSSNPVVDSVAKQAFLTQLNALGDPNTMLAERAAEFFKAHNVDINYNEIASLMNEMNEAFQVQVVAERNNYPGYANEAKQTIKKSVAKLVALGNKYFVAYAKTVTGKGKEDAERQAKALEQSSGMPIIDGKPGGTSDTDTNVNVDRFLKDLGSQLARQNREQSV